MKYDLGLIIMGILAGVLSGITGTLLWLAYITHQIIIVGDMSDLVLGLGTGLFICIVITSWYFYYYDNNYFNFK